jgi:hypothetical protein
MLIAGSNLNSKRFEALSVLCALVDAQVNCGLSSIEIPKGRELLSFLLCEKTEVTPDQMWVNCCIRSLADLTTTP